MKLEGTLAEFRHFLGIGYSEINKGDTRIIDIEGHKLTLLFSEVEDILEDVVLGPLQSRIYSVKDVKLVAEIL